MAILPFTRSGAHASAAAEAIAETLTTDLTQLGAGALSVIGRGATLQYRDNPTDIRRIGDALSVHYAIEGDVRGDDDGRLVIQGRLVSTHTGTQLWAERFETTRDAHAGVLDATARQIAFVVYSRTVEEESRLVMRDQAGNATAEDILMLARAVYNLPRNPRKYEQLIPLFERVLELDPSSLGGLTGLAEALLSSSDFLSEDPAQPVKLERAEALIVRAEASRPDERMVMLARLQLLYRQARCAELLPFARRTKESAPDPEQSRQYSRLVPVT